MGADTPIWNETRPRLHKRELREGNQGYRLPSDRDLRLTIRIARQRISELRDPRVYDTRNADGTIGNSECLFMVWSPWRWILTVPRCHSSGARGSGPQHCTHKHPQVGEIFNWHLDAARYLDLWFCGVESCGAELAQASCPCLLTLRPGEPFLRYPFRLEVLTSVALRRPLDHD